MSNEAPTPYPPTASQRLLGALLWLSLAFSPWVVPLFVSPNAQWALGTIVFVAIPVCALASLIVGIVRSPGIAGARRKAAATIGVLAALCLPCVFLSSVFSRDGTAFYILGGVTLLLWAGLLARYVPIAYASWLARYNALVFMPIGGMALTLVMPACDPCEVIHPPLSARHLPVFALSHFIVVAAYVLSRRAKHRGPAWIDGILWWGLFQHLTLAIQFAPALANPLWILLPPAGGVVLTPIFVLITLGAHIRQRALVAPPTALAIAVFAACALAYFGLASLWSWSWLGALGIYIQTCSGTFARLKPPPANNCCYVVTVAARGHRRIVKPLRVGWRHGEPIIVNRQLAIASAFESLLHERWPIFARRLRDGYDQWGPWLAARVRSQGASDVVYLAMKPAEWIFFACLWWFDRKGAERRIEQTYR